MRRNRRRKSLPKDPVEFDVEKLSHEGRGISHLDGKVIFIDGALPGEKVNAVYTSKKESFDEAKVETVLIAGADRVEPPCVYGEICGGCSLQHFKTDAQLLFKETVLHEKLSHALGSEHNYEHLEPLKGPVAGYRKKARLGVRYVHKKEQVLVGFREKGSSFITNMQSCEVLDAQVSKLLPLLSALIIQMNSFRHIPQIEVAVGEALFDKNCVALIFRHLQPLTKKEQSLLVDFASENAVDLYLQPKGPNTVHKIHPLETEDRLYYELTDFGLNMSFHPLDFTQVNTEINQKMLIQALDLLTLEKSDRVLDLFCGLGNFTLPIATRSGSVTGVEGVQDMVDRGEENAKRNKLDNCQFVCADLTKDITGQDWVKEGFNKILLDPPRSGALEVLDTLVSFKPEKIVYVSCNPATLARDAARLHELGYKLSAGGVMDMFPHTTHVESMALFLPAGSKKG